jgi:hypothetical protein
MTSSSLVALPAASPSPGTSPPTPIFAGSVLVVERDPSFTHPATMARNNCTRQQFATQENVEIA